LRPREKLCKKEREIIKIHYCEINFSHSLWFICAAERVLKDISHHNTVPTATSFSFMWSLTFQEFLSYFSPAIVLWMLDVATQNKQTFLPRPVKAVHIADERIST
jgi:hypothetical protein